MTQTVDAEFRESSGSSALTIASGSETAPAPLVTEEAMDAQLAAFERFKARQIKESDWKTFPGIQGKYLPAEVVDRLAVGVGVSWEIISHDEYGDLGVRTAIVEKLAFEQIKVKRKRRDGSSYEIEVDDETKPIRKLVTRYTVTIRTTAMGRHIDVPASFDSDEMKKTDYQARQQAALRGRRTGTMKLCGNVDYDVWEEEHRALEQAKNVNAAKGGAISTVMLMERAKALGFASSDPTEVGATFCAWARVAAEHCEDLQPGKAPTMLQRQAILRALELAEKSR